MFFRDNMNSTFRTTRHFLILRSLTWGDQGFLARRAILRLKIGIHP